jgi:hypothetical protein
VRLCRFQDVLLADEHRLYDPGNPQDRMVLGIQGAFNEFELSLILDRMQQSLRQKAGRGEQYDALPPGYVCRHASLCEKHPDPRVQRAIEKVLSDFERFPSANQLYLHLRREGFQLPVVPHGHDWRDVEWVEPSYGQILRLVRHPAYAGIYVRGRSKVVVTLDEQGHQQTKRQPATRDEWDVFWEDHHEAYICPATWERNMKKIAANANVRGDLTQGATGRGVSLMAGVLRCGRCGHRLQARYPTSGVRYFCAGGRRQRQCEGAKCVNFYGADLEALLAEEILEVVSPAGVAAAERAAQRLDGRDLHRRASNAGRRMGGGLGPGVARGIATGPLRRASTGVAYGGSARATVALGGRRAAIVEPPACHEPFEATTGSCVDSRDRVERGRVA